MRFVETLIVVLIIIIVTWLLTYAVAGSLTEKKCLEAGYPEFRVTYDFTQYCLNLEGDVTVNVEEL